MILFRQSEEEQRWDSKRYTWVLLTLRSAQHAFWKLPFLSPPSPSAEKDHQFLTDPSPTPTLHTGEVKQSQQLLAHLHPAVQLAKTPTQPEPGHRTLAKSYYSRQRALRWNSHLWMFSPLQQELEHSEPQPVPPVSPL